VHLGVEQDFRAATKAHPAFVVTDLPMLLARIEAAGFRVDEDVALDGYTRRTVTDPFGNRLELMEPA
jgi:Glyoxalase/Bleomycin resistance protein/Dioxygenase superfamily